MKVLILAAGEGTRLKSHTAHIPKPLVPLKGKPIIIHIIEACKKAGLSEFVIVTGYLKDMLEKSLRAYDKNITFVHNPLFETAENGQSAYAARDFFKDENSFMLTMCDHLVEPNLLKKLIQAHPQNGCVLAVDKNMSAPRDISEATKVFVENGVIKKIGKGISRYNAVDTGFFLCTPVLFQALKTSINQKKSRLSEAMQVLADQQKLFAADVTGNFWLDVDTEEELEQAHQKDI